MANVPAQIELVDANGGKFPSTDLLVGAAQWASAQQSLFSRTYEVGDAAPWMYRTVFEAIAKVNEDNLTDPDPGRRSEILVHPGKYLSSTPYLVPGRCAIVGVERFLARFQNDTTDMFVPQGDHVAFSNLLVEGSPTPLLVAFRLNNASNVHLTFVDMLAQGGTARQLFLLQEGVSWQTLLVQHVIVDGSNQSDVLIKVRNTAAGNARDVDTHFNDCFVDALALTSGGGSFQVRKVFEVNFRGCMIRGANAAYTGIRVENGGGTGTSILTSASYISGGAGVAVFGEVNTHYTLTNTDALTSPAPAGTRTLRNSSV